VSDCHGRHKATLSPASDPSPRTWGEGQEAYRDHLFPSPDVAGEGLGMGANNRARGSLFASRIANNKGEDEDVLQALRRRS